MNRWILPVLAILAAFCLCLPGCDSTEPGANPSAEAEAHMAPLPEEHPPLMPPNNPHQAAGQATAGAPENEAPPRAEMKVSPHKVVVPESVKGMWRAVTLQVVYPSGKTAALEAPLGAVTPVPDSALTVEAAAFLPSFFMDDKTITSVNNESKNPAVQVIVREGETIVHEGWLFLNYPDIHPFEKDGLKLTLSGGIATQP